jgi:A/G-specific adenine glycosylase
VSAVSRNLIQWYRRGHRDLPWRRTTDPYRIWLSEIMLQQTRSQTVIPYYERFLERFPTVEDLARSPEADVLALWSGLGYYSRARNLHRAAHAIAASGAFPRDYNALRALPGVGDYTAAAIASIAFGLPHAVLDGNVLRVVARMQNDPADIAAPATRERFRGVAQDWLDSRDPSHFNQALMELGATVCLPRNPICLVCPLASHCGARAAGTVSELPVKLRRIAPESIATAVLAITRDGRVLLRQRASHERRMADFWELPHPEDLPRLKNARFAGTITHTITHHHYTIDVQAAEVRANWKSPPEFKWFTVGELDGIPLSTIARKALGLITSFEL